MAEHKSEPVSVFKEKPHLRFNSKDVKVKNASIGDECAMMVKGKMIGMNRSYEDKKTTNYEMEVENMKPMKGMVKGAMMFREKGMSPMHDEMMNEKPKSKSKKKKKGKGNK